MKTLKLPRAIQPWRTRTAVAWSHKIARNTRTAELRSLAHDGIAEEWVVSAGREIPLVRKI